MSRAYCTPPACQGQIVEVSYLGCDGAILRRCHDQSDGSVTYAVAEIEDDEWSWYATWAPWNDAPPIADDAERWTVISEARARQIAEES